MLKDESDYLITNEAKTVNNTQDFLYNNQDNYGIEEIYLDIIKLDRKEIKYILQILKNYKDSTSEIMFNVYMFMGRIWKTR